LELNAVSHILVVLDLHQISHQINKHHICLL